MGEHDVGMDDGAYDDEMASPGEDAGKKGGKRCKQTAVKGPWAKDEDDVVTRLVGQYGPKRWSLIASNLPGRTGKQCRERWHNQLDPNIKKEGWSEEEDMTLLRAHLELGNHWVEISKRLPGRTDNAIKNRWNSTMRKRAMPDGFFPEGYPASLAVATVDVKDEPAKDVPAPAAAKAPTSAAKKTKEDKKEDKKAKEPKEDPLTPPAKKQKTASAIRRDCKAEERLAMLVEAVTNGNSNAASEPEHEEPVTGMEQEQEQDLDAGMTAIRADEDIVMHSNAGSRLGSPHYKRLAHGRSGTPQTDCDVSSPGDARQNESVLSANKTMLDSSNIFPPSARKDPCFDQGEGARQRPFADSSSILSPSPIRTHLLDRKDVLAGMGASLNTSDTPLRLFGPSGGLAFTPSGFSPSAFFLPSPGNGPLSALKLSSLKMGKSQSRANSSLVLSPIPSHLQEVRRPIDFHDAQETPPLRPLPAGQENACGVLASTPQACKLLSALAGPTPSNTRDGGGLLDTPADKACLLPRLAAALLAPFEDEE